MTSKAERAESQYVRWQFMLPLCGGAILLLVGASLLFADLQTVPWIANRVLCASLLGGLILALAALLIQFILRSLPWLLRHKKQG